MPYFGILLAFVSSWEAVKNQTYKEQTSRAKKMLSTGSGEYTMISHLGLAANQLITSNVARAFFSRTVRLWRRAGGNDALPNDIFNVENIVNAASVP
jgi:hypothetical protein